MSQRQFKVIPVVDVRHGAAVRAVKGDRSSYRPLETPLVPGTSDPVAVALGFRRLYPFDTLYLADLDGIEGRGADHALQVRVAAAWGAGEVWVDDGSMGLLLPPVGLTPFSDRFAHKQSPSPSRGGVRRGATEHDGSSGAREVTPPPTPPRRGEGDAGRSGAIEAPCETRSVIARVLGSESLRDADVLRARPPDILSLDFRGDDFLGPPGLLGAPELWPRRVIVMTLARVGAGTGPDLERLAAVIDRAGPDRLIYAAGGVRSEDDLNELRALGAAGALIATALHNGQIKTGDLSRDRR